MARKKLEILSEQMYYVLLSLHSGPMHGYRIMQYVTALTQGRVVIGPGTLYALLGRFEEEGYIRLCGTKVKCWTEPGSCAGGQDMNTEFRFFPYEAMNYKAAQAWLDRKAAQGWGLARIYLGCIARLQRAEQPSHFVDLDIRSGFDGDTDADYLQLCSDAGWELVQSLRGMLLFRSAPGPG